MAPLISVPDAADALGLSPARVRLLAANGGIPAQKIGGRWVVERSGVEKRRSRGSAGGRPFAPRNAWAVLGLASGDEVDGVDPAVRSRYAGRSLWRASVPSRFGSSVGPRCIATPGIPGRSLRSCRQKIGRLGHQRRSSGRPGCGRGKRGGRLHSSRELEGFVGDHALFPAAAVDANVVLRVVPDDVWADFLKGRPHASEAAIGLDLAEDADSRSRAAGKKLLGRLDSGR